MTSLTPTEQLYSLYLAWEKNGSHAWPLAWLALEQGRPDITVEVCPVDQRKAFARELLRKVAQQPDPTLRFGLGFLYFKSTRYQAAILQFARVSATSEVHPWAVHLTGLCYRNLGQPGIALDCFRQALELIEAQPEEHLEVFFHLAGALYQAGKYHECLTILERQLQLDPQDAEVARRIDQVRRMLAGGPGPRGPASLAAALPGTIRPIDAISRLQVSA
ncbi:MAG: CDC27 family protein [Candidatus Eremiobacteraeota bacterium]|nr:CDC27 family protein [Candidatus Eremiobacteraeota bacterium]